MFGKLSALKIMYMLIKWRHCSVKKGILVLGGGGVGGMVAKAKNVQTSTAMQNTFLSL